MKKISQYLLGLREKKLSDLVNPALNKCSLEKILNHYDWVKIESFKKKKVLSVWFLFKHPL